MFAPERKMHKNRLSGQVEYLLKSRDLVGALQRTAGGITRDHVGKVDAVRVLQALPEDVREKLRNLAEKMLRPRQDSAEPIPPAPAVQSFINRRPMQPAAGKVLDHVGVGSNPTESAAVNDSDPYRVGLGEFGGNIMFSRNVLVKPRVIAEYRDCYGLNLVPNYQRWVEIGVMHETANADCYKPTRKFLAKGMVVASEEMDIPYDNKYGFAKYEMGFYQAVYKFPVLKFERMPKGDIDNVTFEDIPSYAEPGVLGDVVKGNIVPLNKLDGELTHMKIWVSNGVGSASYADREYYHVTGPQNVVAILNIEEIGGMRYLLGGCYNQIILPQDPKFLRYFVGRFPGVDIRPPYQEECPLPTDGIVLYDQRLNRSYYFKDNDRRGLDLNRAVYFVVKTELVNKGYRVSDPKEIHRTHIFEYIADVNHEEKTIVFTKGRLRARNKPNTVQHCFRILFQPDADVVREMLKEDEKFE